MKPNETFIIRNNRKEDPQNQKKELKVQYASV